MHLNCIVWAFHAGDIKLFPTKLQSLASNVLALVWFVVVWFVAER